MARKSGNGSNGHKSTEVPLKREFISLFKASGWTQAEVARQLELTRGGVNGIITGSTVPSQATLKLFKLILLAEKPKAMNTGTSLAIRRTEKLWLRELIAEMRRVAPPHRARLVLALKTMATAFPKDSRASARKEF
jgi:transcriptional regulator with XRE-family HTH domain